MPERHDGSWSGGGPNDPIEMVTKVWEDLRRQYGGRRPGRFSPWLIVAIALALYALSGIYIVAPDERGVVLRFGRVVREADPGPGYHLPWPIEQVLKPIGHADPQGGVRLPHGRMSGRRPAIATRTSRR